MFCVCVCVCVNDCIYLYSSQTIFYDVEREFINVLGITSKRNLLMFLAWARSLFVLGHILLKVLAY